MSGPEFAIRLCTRTADEPDPLPGTVVRQCGRCKASVWYDPLQELPYPATLD